ncbi:27 kDa hemolymph protein-like [Contarinia nasturtii]|uniref:27 kDa hemolymph protein-like n=1 Tax=Contarinia nasturtii TaxID=265458 RepID=UPI0012D44404|nr:27 kDa hemolymph protein-like [Contarinia nasturtii]XP_031641081.1 27 kDa hemolymph protein-like [Contarinia nasturtii]
MFHRNRLFFLVLLTIALSGQIECDDPPQLDLDKLRESINVDDINKNLPPGMEIPASFKNITLPKLDDIKNMMKEKCKTVSGGEEAYNAIETGAAELQNCTSGLIDVPTLQDEIDKAQPKGELDTVFNKYCRKRSTVIGCLENFTAVLEPCLEPKEIEGKRTFVKIFKNLLNFVCYKDGDQIALFIAEKGPQCFTETKDELISCMNATFFNYLPSEKEIESKTVPTELPQLVMGQEQCNDMDSLQGCVVKSLEKCQESTPANLVESMFKFVRNETPCGNMTSQRASESQLTGNANTQTVSMTSLIASILALITVKLVTV